LRIENEELRIVVERFARAFLNSQSGGRTKLRIENAELRMVVARFARASSILNSQFSILNSGGREVAHV
jgi:hypothetical protein